MADNLFNQALTFNHVNAGLVAGTTSSYTTTATTVCSIRGKFATGLTAQTNTASPTTDATTGAAFVALSAIKQPCWFGASMLPAQSNSHRARLCRRKPA